MKNAMTSNGMRNLVAIVGLGLSCMAMGPHVDTRTPRRRYRTYRVLAAALGALLLAWTVPARAQAPATPAPAPAVPYPGVPPSATLPYWPEPPEHLLTPEEPLPMGDPPLLRRVVPGLADGMAPLPPFLRDTALSLHLRTFYFNRLNPDDTQNEAWAFGGWLAYQSGWLWDTFAIGTVGYTALPLYAPDGKPGTLLLQPPDDPIFVLGQVYGQLRYKAYALLTGGRLLVDDGYVNPNDSRMVPNTFEGATLTGQIGPVGYNVGYLTAMKPRQAEDFQNMAEIAGVQDRHRGLVLLRLSGEPLPGLALYGANTSSPTCSVPHMETWNTRATSLPTSPSGPASSTPTSAAPGTSSWTTSRLGTSGSTGASAGVVSPWARPST